MEHEYEDQIKCPYCDYENEHDSEDLGKEEEELVYTCGECEKEFLYYTQYNYDFSTKKSCEKHDLGKTGMTYGIVSEGKVCSAEIHSCKNCDQMPTEFKNMKPIKESSN